MTSNAHLQFLSLKDCNLDDERFGLICEGFSNLSSKVKYFDVSNNRIGKKGLEMLIKNLHNIKNLSHFGIANNGLKTVDDIDPLLSYICKHKMN